MLLDCILKKSKSNYILFITNIILNKRTQIKMNMKKWKNTYHTHTNLKKGNVALLISDEIHFKTKSITGYKEEFFIIYHFI